MVQMQVQMQVVWKTVMQNLVISHTLALAIWNTLHRIVRFSILANTDPK
jgi:hypothetical protein